MSNLNDQLGTELDRLRADGLYRQLRTIASAQGPRVVIEGREFLNFSSNDYLGLANDPVLKRAGIEAIERYGLGAGASRLVSGNLQPYDELEDRLARFKNKEAAIVFGSGYAANVGTIAALVGEGDIVVLDKLDHASIIDGARQSGATIRVYQHKDLRKLEALLQWATGRGGDAAPTSRMDNEGVVGAASPPRPARILIVTETVFSMDGDLAPLAEIVTLKEKYGAWLMIDEAHATGVFGEHRRGLAEAAGVEDHVDVTLGTLSKALGCAGGYVAGSQTLIDFLRNRARSLIYSTALPPSIVAAAAAAVDLVAGAEGRQRCARLWRNVAAFGAASPIIPVVIGDEAAAMKKSQELYKAGIFVPAIRYPTVPKGKARLRVTVTAAHEPADVTRFLEVCEQVWKAGCGEDDDPITPQTLKQPVGAASSPRSIHSAALRRGRVSIPEECYFVTTCVRGRRPVLSRPGAGEVVVDAIRWLRDRGRIRLLGFVVMPDHLHFAFALRAGESRRGRRSHDASSSWTLAEVMHTLKSFCAHKLKRDFGIEPPVWQDGYHDHQLRDRRDFEQRLAYMHGNPVRKGLTKMAEQYPLSTAHPDYAEEIDWAWLEGVPDHDVAR